MRKLWSGRWQASFLGPNGRRQSAPNTYASKGDTDRWLARVELDLSDGTWVDDQLGRVAFGDYAREWLENGSQIGPRWRETCERNLRLHLAPLAGRGPANVNKLSRPSRRVTDTAVRPLLPARCAILDAMAYDDELANRIRRVVQGERGLGEKRMFGGLAFLVNGKMAVSASHQGGLLLRSDPTQAESLVSETHVHRFEMRGREMDGWLRVDAQAVETEEELRRWVSHGVDYARSLAPK